MLKKFRITVDGKQYDVSVEDLTEGGGRLYPDPGSMAMPVAPVAPVAPAPAASAAAAPAAGPGDEVSPLAGVVVAVEVAVGQQVTAGQKIITLEAMKMKTVVYANRGGSVVNIAVKPGDAVETGQTLITIA